jgi:hypothetical protein
MRQLKKIGLVTSAVTVALAFAGAANASATAMEVTGKSMTTTSVTIEASLKSGTSAVLESTSSSFVDTCTSSTVKGKTEFLYGSTVTGKVSTLTFSNCTHVTKVVTNGSLAIEHSGGTNGTVRSHGALVEVQSTTFGVTLECTTSNTHLGTLAGVAHGHATINVNAVVNCGFFMPSALWQASYAVTSPTGLGVVAI